MNIEIMPVDNSSLLKQFIGCSKTLNPRQPEDPFGADMFNPHLNRWFDTGKAKLFLAVQDNRIVGRVAGFIEPRLATSAHGYFGLLETVNDVQVCRQLLGRVENWLLSHGKSIFIGPVLFNSNYGRGFLVEDYGQFVQSTLPVNPPYYPTLLENSGYVKEKDFFAYRWNLSQAVPEKFRKAALRAKKNGVVIHPLEQYPLLQQIELFSTLYHQAMNGTWEFTPLNNREIKDILLTLYARNDPELFLIALSHSQPAAFCLTLIEKPSREQVKEVRLAVLGVAPLFRRRGIEAALITSTINKLRGKSIQAVEVSYVAEDNLPVIRLIAAAAGAPFRRYRVYRKSSTF